MLFSGPRRTATVASVVPFFSARAARLYQDIPVLPVGRVESPLPSLSIIVPARNEAHNLDRLLASLRQVVYPGDLQIVVVDDESTDGTGAVAERYGACVLRLDALPEGWRGKPRACYEGAKAARGEWFLFVDADTEHAPHGPASAVAYAVQRQLDGLSLWLRDETNGLLDGLAMLAAQTGLFVGLSREHGFLNGQYVLLRRDVYWKSGGHAAVAREDMEDVSLGHHLLALDYRVPLLRGEQAATVRMYNNVRQLWHGMSRWSSGSLPWFGLSGWLTFAFITESFTPLLMLLSVLAGRLRAQWLALAWGVVAVAYLPWARWFGKAWWALLAPIGAAFILLAATWGLLARFLGRGVHWKDRAL